MIVKLGELLGRGGFANVYRAIDPKDATPLAIAIKKSRVSKRIRRPPLQHEAHLLLYSLAGHPAIPRVLAYGHLVHFEYLALELLGKSLQEITPKDGMGERTVANFAIQLLSALEFIHSHGVIHRDVKPSNVLISLEKTPTLRLIDFGGLLDLVSRHSSRRDDLESLSYTLLFLLRGNLPWERYDRRSGTLAGNMKQVREKKRRWHGQRLGKGLAKEFGELLDYARALEFESKPDYGGLTKGFQRLLGNKETECLDFPLAIERIPHSHVPHKLPIHPLPAPVSRGQLIYVKLLSRPSIEGYTMRALDPSYWEDASLLRPELETKKRPAVVLSVERLGAYWTVKVLPLRRRPHEADDGDVSAIYVSPQCLESSPRKKWSWGKIVAFGFPCAETFFCLPDQRILTPARWSLPESNCAQLAQLFDRRLRTGATSADEQLRLRIYDKMRCKMYAALLPLEDPYVEDVQGVGDITWDGARGWLDEMAKVARRHVFEQIQEWSRSEKLRSAMERNEDVTEDAPSDSNSNPWMTEWWPQGGRDMSVTFTDGCEGSGEKKLDRNIEQIENVVKK